MNGVPAISGGIPPTNHPKALRNEVFEVAIALAQ